MPHLAIHAGRVLTPLEEISDARIVIADGRIRELGPRSATQLPPGAREFDAHHWTAVPGFVDIHIHGAGGRDVMEPDAAAFEAVATTAARFGTTSLLATTVSASIDQTCRSVEAAARYILAGRGCAAGTKPVAEILGVHFEGPFISHARRGVHPADAIQRPSTEKLQKLLDAAGGFARILTLAPELAGGLELVAAARRAGLVVALGHTDATYEQACAAIQAGASHAVHTFNAMRPFSHRDTGVLGAVLTSPEVTAELIADGVHVDAPAIRLLLAAKGVERVILVSDSTAAAAMPDGKYLLGTFEVTVAGGVSRNAEGRLAGSTLTLDRALRHIVSLGVPLADAVRMMTLNPARRLGLDPRKGLLAPGADADIVLLDNDLRVAGVLTRGSGLNH